jgi:hypothetical protein
VTCLFLEGTEYYCRVYDRHVPAQMVLQSCKPDYCEVVGCRAVKEEILDESTD